MKTIEKKALLFLTLILTLALPARGALAQTADESGATQKEIYAAWIEYLNSLKSFSGKKERHQTDADGQKTDSVSEFVSAPPYMSSVFSYTDTDLSYQSISVTNPRYYASIQISDGEKQLRDATKLKDSDRFGGEWFDIETDDYSQRTTDNRINYAVLAYLGTPLRLLPFWLPRIMKDDRFAIESIEYQEEGGRRTAAMTLAADGLVVVSPLYELQRVRLTLMPEHYWLPVRAESEIFDRGNDQGEKISLENEYDFRFSVPILTRQVRKVEGHVACEEEITVTGVTENPRIRPKDFTVSHYGIGEPAFPDDPAGWVQPTLITLGALLTVTALILIRKKRRA